MTHSAGDCARTLSLAGHELRTPISVVAGYLRMLLQGLPGPLSDGQRKLLEESLKSCSRLTTLTGELSELAQLEADTLPFDNRPIVLFSLVAEAAGEVSPLPETEARIELAGEEAGAELRGDPARLRAAFRTIIAACAREAPFRSVLVVHRSGGEHDGRRAALVAIADGARAGALGGSPLGDLAPFDPWRGGLGLGLIIGARVIERHGGRLLTPREEPKGAAVVVLPLEG